jgi:hypothetical protein
MRHFQLFAATKNPCCLRAPSQVSLPLPFPSTGVSQQSVHSLPCLLEQWLSVWLRMPVVPPALSRSRPLRPEMPLGSLRRSLLHLHSTGVPPGETARMLTTGLLSHIFVPLVLQRGVCKPQLASSPSRSTALLQMS